MNKFILTKKAKGKRFEYTVTDVAGNVISKRVSVRDNYVAATANGEFYFGRLDLIGKGEHGRRLSAAMDFFSDPKQAYRNMINYYIPEIRAEMRAKCPYEEFVKSRSAYYEITIKEMNQIAYLRQ